MHKTLQSLSLLHCLCLIAAPASATPFISPSGSYSLTLPAGWHSNPNYRTDNDAVFTLGDPHAAPSKMVLIVTVTIASAPPGMTMTTLKSKLVPNFKKGPPNTVIISQTSSSIGGTPDLDTVFVATQQGKRVRSRIVYVLKNKFIYAITAICSEKVHAKYDPVFAQMLASVRWK